MLFDKPIHRIAVVGAGVIGASWAAQYLACGFEVVATDPARDAEASLRAYVDEAWEHLAVLGLSPGAARDRLRFVPNLHDAVAQADFVQENGPERPEFKIQLFADIDKWAPADTIIASSSSGLTMTVIQSRCVRPERCLIGHPFNPPHIIPLVEVVGGAKTSAAAVEQAMRFYASIGKKPTPGGALSRGRVPGRARGAQRRRGRRCRQLGTRASLGGHGSEPPVAHRRWRGRDPALHGPPHGSAGWTHEDTREPERHVGGQASYR
jgi:hypothetical protein